MAEDVADKGAGRHRVSGWPGRARRVQSPAHVPSGYVQEASRLVSGDLYHAHHDGHLDGTSGGV
jgi:hypothetical protein